MANRRHVINVHTSTSTVAPRNDADLRLGEIAVQHTSGSPALWIKMGESASSQDYEKFIGQTEILSLIESSNILGSGYTYSGLPYINSATSIADAFSAVTDELLKDEITIAASLNELDRRINEQSSVMDDTEEIIAGAINVLSDRVGTIETQMTGDYIPITGYEIASGTTEEELSLDEEDTVDEAFGKLQKQMLDNEEAIAAGFNDINVRLSNIDEQISHNTGITTLSGVVQTLTAKTNELSAVTAELSAATYDGFDYLYEEVLPNYTSTALTYELSGAVESISAKTSGVLTLNLNGVEQGKYSPSANTTINLEAIQEITGADVLLTGYELATGTTEEELVVLATDTVNEAFGKLQKQNYDNEAVVAGALNDLDERVTGIELSGVTEEDIEALSASVISYVESVVASAVQYKGSTSTVPQNPENGDMWIASADFVVGNQSAETGDFIIYNGTDWDVIEKNLDGAVTGALTANTVTLGDSAHSVKSLANGTEGQVLGIVSNVPSWMTINTELEFESAGTGNVITSLSVSGNEISIFYGMEAAEQDDLLALSGAVLEKNFVIAQALNNHEARIIELSGDVATLSAATSTACAPLSAATYAHINDNTVHVTSSEKEAWTNGVNSGVSAWTAVTDTDAAIVALSASVVANETNIGAVSGDVIELSAATSAISVGLDALSGAVLDKDLVIAQALNNHEDRLLTLEASAATKAEVKALSASVMTVSGMIQNAASESDVNALSATVLTNEYVASMAINDLQSDKENVSNKVTSISSASTDTQYPSAKCVYDALGNIESLLAAL